MTGLFCSQRGSSYSVLRSANKAVPALGRSVELQQKSQVDHGPCYYEQRAISCIPVLEGLISHISQLPATVTYFPNPPLLRQAFRDVTGNEGVAPGVRRHGLLQRSWTRITLLSSHWTCTQEQPCVLLSRSSVSQVSATMLRPRM